MRARIYKPSRTAMQSGKGRTRRWRLDFEGLRPPEIDPLMGWTAGTDTRRQLRLEFPTREDAIAYAERHGIEYRVEEAKSAVEKQIAYADNFRGDRAAPWTH
ncbi:ETC complex I subunit [Acuticoccus mangrovi]|uniref:ETC complex I subunit n=1 Tax=Acuticoccus mangrovi TaxID=2796142 RepID=A0A934MJ34_9HYPH|nr:ETC complex I subunit [Acuticoccus mangrovi]MBJ3774194.1 ETC complex I subunit [Acuticoccus mangrovi]